MRLSDRGLALIAGFEGFRTQPYTDPAGHCTVGYGHLLHTGPCNGSEPRISQEEALELLRADVGEAEQAVARLVTVPLNQNQFDALCSFAFNVGAGKLEESALLVKLNAGNHAAVPRELKRWTRGGGRVLPGLVARRAEEGELFAEPVQPELSPVAQPLPPLRWDKLAWAMEQAARQLRDEGHEPEHDYLMNGPLYHTILYERDTTP